MSDTFEKINCDIIALMAEISGKGKTFKLPVLYFFVFISGFISLSTEIIGPRLFASFFGTTTIIWAIMISVTLGGLSLGYYIGGNLVPQKADKMLPLALILNAVWLLLTSWLVWLLPPLIGIGILPLTITAVISFLIPFTVFGMISPISISLASLEISDKKISKVVGNIFALGTAGSILGALVAAFILIPFIGLSTSLRIFAVIQVLFAFYFHAGGLKKSLIVLFFIICLLVPQPDYKWKSDDILLNQSEGYFQTIRIYTNKNRTATIFHLGPTYESDIDPRSGEPLFGYAGQMVSLVGNASGKRILSIGGAGHSMARSLEKRGAIVTEVEIDPFVISASDRFFGRIKGEEINQDGRVYLNRASPGTFDYILIDAFNGPTSIPEQLTTLECFKAIKLALKPSGKMLYNFIGIPQGEGSDSFLALSRTMSDVFRNVRSSQTKGYSNQNIIFMASDADINDYGVKVPVMGTLLTDDLNPIDIYLFRARRGFIDYHS